MSTEKKYNDVEVIENYGNMFVFEVDEHISGNYLIFHDSKEGVVTHADTTFYLEDNQYKLSIDNAWEIDKGYIHYELPNKISCQYSVDLSGNIDLYFNYDNYLNPKFKSIELYRNSFLHLNKDNPEGLLAIAGEYKEKYEMPGAYYVFTNLSDTKPKFSIRRLTYQQKVKWLKDRYATYNTDDLVDYVDDDQYLRLKDKDHEIDVTEEDFINNDNLHLAGGDPLEYDIPIDPDDQIQIKEVDEYVYLYLDCEFTSTESITGDVGITDTMRISPVTATLKYNGNVLKHFNGTPATITGMTLHGYTTDLPSTGKSFFYPMFLDFNNIVIPSYTGIEGMIFDLKVDDITMANKVASVTSNTGEASKYGVSAKISFSDNTGYQVVEHDTTRILGGRKKIYGIYIIVNGYGEFSGTLDTLAQKVADEVYLPELRDPVKGGGGSGGVLKELDFDVLNTQKEIGISKLFRIHDIYNMGLSTLGKFYTGGTISMGGYASFTADVDPKFKEKVTNLLEQERYCSALGLFYSAILNKAKSYNVATWIQTNQCMGEGVVLKVGAGGCQYGSVDLKSVIFGYDHIEGKAYMWIPYSKNKSNYDGLMFAYSEVAQSDQFVRASVYENDCRVEGSTGVPLSKSSLLYKEFVLDDYDFVDIPEGYQASLYSLGTPVGMLTKNRLACYDFKSANGTVYVQASCYKADTASIGSSWTLYIDNVAVKDKSAATRITYQTTGGTNNSKSSAFNKDSTCLGGSGIYDIKQAWQMFHLNYEKIFTSKLGDNTGHDIDKDAGLTFAVVGTSPTDGNQVFVAQPQMAIIDFDAMCSAILYPKISNGKKSHLSYNIYEIRLRSDVTYKNTEAQGGYDWFKTHRIRCIFMTKGYYDWNGDKFVSTQFTYQRYQTKKYNGFVLNIIYAGNSGESDVMVEVPANILNAYLQSMPSFIPLNDMNSMTAYNPETSEQRPTSQTTSIFDLYSSVNAPPTRDKSNRYIKEMIQKSTQGGEYVWYDVKVTIPPVQGITYVCCDTTEDIIKDSSKASIVAMGTSNGLYYMNDGVPTLSSIESGNVKRIVKVHITSSKYSYIALVDGKLYYTLDDGATWEQCQNDFPSQGVTDITTDIKATSKNNTAIVANGHLYYGNVIQKKVTNTDSTDKVDTTKV